MGMDAKWEGRLLKMWMMPCCNVKAWCRQIDMFYCFNCTVHVVLTIHCLHLTARQICGPSNPVELASGAENRVIRPLVSLRSSAVTTCSFSSTRGSIGPSQSKGSSNHGSCSPIETAHSEISLTCSTEHMPFCAAAPHACLPSGSRYGTSQCGWNSDRAFAGHAFFLFQE